MSLYELETLHKQEGLRRSYRIVRRTNVENGRQILQVRATLHTDTRERVINSWVADVESGIESIEANEHFERNER